MRPLTIAAVALILTGCSTFQPAQAPTGLMWGYLGESQAVPTLRMVMYASDRPTCEVTRAKDMKPQPTAEWAALKVPAECRQIVIGPGTDYWVYVFPVEKGAIGATDREWCVKMRDAVAKSYRGWIGDCQPVAVKVMP